MEYIFTCIDPRLWIEKKSLYKTGAIQSTVLYRGNAEGKATGNETSAVEISDSWTIEFRR